MTPEVFEGVMSSKDKEVHRLARPEMIKTLEDLNSRPLYLYREIELRKKLIEYLRYQNLYGS